MIEVTVTNYHGELCIQQMTIDFDRPVKTYTYRPTGVPVDKDNMWMLGCQAAYQGRGRYFVTQSRPHPPRSQDIYLEDWERMVATATHHRSIDPPGRCGADWQWQWFHGYWKKAPKEAIVPTALDSLLDAAREIAETPTWYYSTVRHTLCCSYCGVYMPTDARHPEWLRDPSNHSESCIWRKLATAVQQL